MFSITYPCTFVQFKNINDGVHMRTHIYTFRAANKLRYLVEFDEFIGNVFLVKFYQKNHSNSINKYNVLTNSGWACSVVFTVFTLMFKIWRDNSFGHISYAFMGSNTIMPNKEPESKNNTKRFKFYKRVIANFMGDENFRFKQNVDSSIFVMLNKRNHNVDLSLEIILKYIYRNYSILDIDLILEPIRITAQSG